MTDLTVRPARPDEYAEIGDVTVDVYRRLRGNRPGDYDEQLRDVAGRARESDVFVAVDASGSVLGAVAFAPYGSSLAEQSVAGEAVFRMLAVAPAARGRGAGQALVEACIARARELGLARLRLSTQPTMEAAHRLYERLGFARTPDRDWSPREGIDLITYSLELQPAYCDRCGEDSAGDHTACTKARRLEPPRYCSDCRRRMTVQVTPTGWTATCAEHGTRTS